MTLNDAFEGHSIKSTQLMENAAWLLLPVAASLILAFAIHNGILLSLVLVLGTLVIPVVCVLTRRRTENARQRETEDLLMMNIRTYLQNQEPARAVSDIEFLARAIDGRRLPTEDFRKVDEIASLVPVGYPVFDASPRPYAIRSLYERRFADLAMTLLAPAA